MDFINGLTLLLVYELVGESMAVFLHVPVPGPVIGMLLLFVTLRLRRRSIVALDTAGTALLSHLSLLFVPAGVGLMVHFPRIVEEWRPISLTLVLSTMITLITTAVTMMTMMHLLNKSVKNSG